MIKHYCDSCGVEVNDENGVVKSKEITLELPGKKISIAMEIDTMNMNTTQSDANPVICALCLAVRVGEWGKSISDASVAQGTEHRISNATVDGSNPSGGANCQQ